jgi:alkaline phosphatase
MRKCLLCMFLVLSVAVFAQENYKTSHPVSSFVNPASHAIVNVERSARFASKPRTIILLIGDGAGVAQLYGAYTANKGALNIFQMPVVGFIKTYSHSHYITDSGAGGTAIACGVKTNNGAIGVDANGQPVKSVLHLAEQKGLKTGLVSSSAITHATPASFIAHAAQRSSYEDIAADFLKTDIDLFIGGGRKHFEQRADGRNLTNELKSKGYTVAYGTDVELAGVEKLAVLTADEHNAAYPYRGDMLPKSTAKAIDFLANSKKGYFLMVEGSQIDWGGHQNDAAYTIGETLDFDQAVGHALAYALKDKRTLVIVTADHETGGMSLVGGSVRNGEVKASFNSSDHTAEMVPLFAFGAGANKLAGVYENTDLFAKMVELLSLNKTAKIRR